MDLILISDYIRHRLYCRIRNVIRGRERELIIPGIWVGRQAVRRGPWKLVHLDIRNDNERYELYNLDEAPSETTDILEANPEKAGELKAIMAESHVPNPDFPVLRGE